ncbi:hypothetical protein ACXYTJ_12730 [Gilvimarinus sp. F26214L]|uniref:hypothetical protein n=1 Tax=Gilvimarinus sp. DZF01 TaxID=3461371 RepID=UPI004045ACD8
MGRTILLAVTCLLLVACKKGTLQHEVPAVLSEPGPEVRAELRKTVAAAMNRESILLAEDALVTSSQLIVERKVQRDPQGGRILGRDLGEPEHFRLSQRDGACVLEQQSSGRSWVLKSARCRPE